MMRVVSTCIIVGGGCGCGCVDTPQVEEHVQPDEKIKAVVQDPQAPVAHRHLLVGVNRRDEQRHALPWALRRTGDALHCR